MNLEDALNAAIEFKSLAILLAEKQKELSRIDTEVRNLRIAKEKLAATLMCFVGANVPVKLFQVGDNQAVVVQFFKQDNISVSLVDMI